MDHDLSRLRDQAEQCFLLARRLDADSRRRAAIEELGHDLLRQVCRLERRQNDSPPPETSTPVRGCLPKLSDDDLLGLIVASGRICDLTVLHRSLNEQIGDEVDLAYLLRRLQRLCRTGALRILEPSAEGSLRFELVPKDVRRGERVGPHREQVAGSKRVPSVR